MTRRDYFRSHYQKKKSLRTQQQQLLRLRRAEGLEPIAENTSNNKNKKQKTKKDKSESESLAIKVRQQQRFVEAVAKVTKVINAAAKELKPEAVLKHQPSEFELLREENRRRNAEFLANLGIMPKHNGEQNKVEEVAVPTKEVAVAQDQRKFWLAVGDEFLTEFMVPYGDGTEPVPVGALVGRCFDTSPGYFFGIVGPKEKRGRVTGHCVHYTDGDVGWLSVAQLRLVLVKEDRVVQLFPNVRRQVEEKMGKGAVV